MISVDGSTIYPGNLGLGYSSGENPAALHGLKDNGRCGLKSDEYREILWPEDDAGESLRVLVHPLLDEHDEAWFKACVLKQFPTRKKLLSWGIRHLPKGMKVLYPKRSGLTSLPKGFRFDGDLDVTCCHLKELPEGLWIGGLLKISGLQHEGVSEITELPNGLHVEGNLILRNNQNIKTLPDGIFIGGSLYLQNSSITELPRGLQVGGNLNLCGTKITTLPDDLSVGGWICVGDSAIKKIPPGIRPEQVKV